MKWAATTLVVFAYGLWGLLYAFQPEPLWSMLAATAWWIYAVPAVALVICAFLEIRRNVPVRHPAPINPEIQLLIGFIVFLWIALDTYVKLQIPHLAGPLGRAAAVFVPPISGWIAVWIAQALRKRFEPKDEVAESEDSTP